MWKVWGGGVQGRSIEKVGKWSPLTAGKCKCESTPFLVQVACRRCQTTGAAGTETGKSKGKTGGKAMEGLEKSTLTHIDMDMAKPMNMYKNIRMQWLDGSAAVGKWEMHIYVIHTHTHTHSGTQAHWLTHTHTHTHVKHFLRLQQGHHQQEQQQRLLLYSVNSCRDWSKKKKEKNNNKMKRKNWRRWAALDVRSKRLSRNALQLTVAGKMVAKEQPQRLQPKIGLDHSLCLKSKLAKL